MEVRRIGSIKQIGQGAEIIGNKTRVKIVKNKFAPPFKKVEFPIVFGKGISHFDLLVEIAVEHDIVNRSGSWFSYGEIKIGQGSEKVKDFLLENEEILNEIEVKVKVALGLIESSEDETENDKED
jgi:recombination protein RecA